ncbi:MAG: hypothetical protein ACF8PN_03685 [Phycisphaerales bacterium]
MNDHHDQRSESERTRSTTTVGGSRTSGSSTGSGSASSASTQSKASSKLESTKAAAKEKAAQAHETIRASESAGAASRAANELRGRAYEAANLGKGRVAEEIRRFGSAFDAAGDRLDEEDDARVGSYVHGARRYFDDVANYLDEHDANDIARDARDLACKSPAVCLGAAALAGLAFGRFISASQPESEYSGGSAGYRSATPSTQAQTYYGTQDTATGRSDAGWQSEPPLRPGAAWKNQGGSE